MFKVLSQQLQGTLTMVSDRHFAVENVTEIVRHTSKLINISAKHTLNKILSWLGIMKQKLTKVYGKLSVEQKSKLEIRRTLQQTEQNRT